MERSILNFIAGQRRTNLRQRRLIGMLSNPKAVGTETGRCGICMEEVIDRGLLDCCNHWFCFKCIDNWAVITNLCPLCKAQFEIITCVPVHDTIGGSSEWNNSTPEGTERDEGWCIYGDNRALSFPSYYIDEDAIVCLDGDGCKIRSGVTTEESSSLDTSVACDSCDIWYHALCVGFDPEFTIEGTWLCPRCKMSGLLENLNSTFCQSSPDKDQSRKFCDDMLLNSKMSVHVADAGETAVVVSMFEGENCGPATEEEPGKVASFEDKHNANKISSALCTGQNTVNSKKHGGDELLSNFKENFVSKGCTAPSINDLSSGSVEDCIQIPSVAVINKEIKHNSLNISMLEGEKDASATQPNSGDVALMVEEEVTNKVFVPLCTDVNMNSIGREQQDLLFPENILSADDCKSFTVFPPMNDSKEVLDEDCSPIPTTIAPSKEINHVNTVSRSEVSDSATESRDRARPTSLVENSQACVWITDSQNIVKPSTDKSRKEKNDVVGEFLPQIAKSFDKSHAKIGEKHSGSYLVGMSLSQVPTNGSKLSADKDTAKRINAEGSILDREPPQSSTGKNLDSKCRDAVDTRDSMLVDQGCGKIAKQKEITTKRARLSGQNEHIHLLLPKTQCNANQMIAPKDAFGLKKKLRAEKLENHSKCEIIPSDLMEIVKGQEFNFSAKTQEHCSPRKTGSENNRGGSVRLKKIMPRRMDESEASRLVQEMTKELRAAVGNGTMEDLGKIDAYDERLLEAFKAAMKKTFKSDNKSNLCHVKVNKQPQKRGKIRENLTRKIYSTGSGKRRRAWDRDCEIEFWKSRCNREKKIRQIETPDLIKNLLKKSLDACSKSPEIENKSKINEVDPIFSRLYVADNSLFPRNDDIKPLSALSESGDLQAGKCNIGVKGEVTSNKLDILGSNLNNIAGNIHSTKRCLDAENSSSSLNIGSLQNTASKEKAADSGDTNLDEVVEPKSGKSDDVKLDKRKWALEVLARKTGGSQKTNELSTGEKVSFPLLIQLPIDMRPTLPHDRRSKVPTSIRQMQLNRFVELYLKNANMETIRRTAESEFAVADAVNMEKEIYERSNSKSVYINLCAQALSQQSCSYKAVENDDAYHELETELGDDVTAALKDAGLISDSPIGSPYRVTEDSGVESDTVAENKDDATGCIENVLELDCQPDLDIYGDFEYDLEDVEDPATSSILNSIRIPAIQSKDTASKVKVVLSSGQWSKQSANEQVDGGHKKQTVENSATGEPKPLVSTGEFKSEENNDTFLSLDDTHARSATEGSEKLASTMDENHSAISCPDAGRDIKFQVPNISLSEDGRSEHTNLKGLSAKSIGNQDQLSFRKNDLNQVDLQINSFPCPVKDSVSDSQLVSDQLSDTGDGLGLVKLPPGAIRGNTKRGSPDCEKDVALLETNKQNAEMNQNFSASIQPGGNCAKKNREIGRTKPRVDVSQSIWKKVESYIKEHIRPLCKSGVVTVEQYRWAVGKTVEKVMKYHSDAKNADFLISEGNKVKKLAEQYLQTFKKKETC
ncbi:uncharacterized protein LOC131044252 isoform X1 [Cryptomeria japonica]|uniref:uncharacterized protein LOC131044252 isoform X1 n=1 Tax=Cryptomeria japonica TaxID=3369 RepID=UPI0025ACEE7A|nr:uncharacterized protein LOC131044252 isoform X1 [Cryptomeria japonica]